jgi:hypothetical protein
LCVCAHYGTATRGLHFCHCRRLAVFSASNDRTAIGRIRSFDFDT